MPAHIDAEEAQEIAWDKPLAFQTVSEHRWYTTRLVVFERDGSHWGFYYFDPVTEEQDGQDRFESDPVPVFPVVAREVVTTVYEKVPDGE